MVSYSYLTDVVVIRELYMITDYSAIVIALLHIVHINIMSVFGWSPVWFI